MTKPILRNVTLALTLEQLAAAFKKSEWIGVNDYLDKDVEFGSIDTSFAKNNLKDSTLGLYARYCPNMLNRAYSDAQDSAHADEFSRQRREWILKALRKVDVGQVEYYGKNSDDAEVFVKGMTAKILDAQLHGSIVTVEIENPEHLLNMLSDNYNFSPANEILIDTAMDVVTQQRNFLAGIYSFYTIYAELPSCDFESNAYPDDKDTISFLKEMDKDELAQDIANSVFKILSSASMDDLKKDITRLERELKIDDLEDQIRTHVKEKAESDMEALREKLGKIA